MQIGQNAKVLNINNPKYSILGVLIENQYVKGVGLLYGGFGLFIFDIFAFCIICILSDLHFVVFAFCLICILLYLQYVGFAFCQICILSFFLHFVCLNFVKFAFCLDTTSNIDWD